MFKIVQTIEKGKPHLCIVPSTWENNGILQWPRNKADKLVLDSGSLPQEDWFSMPCRLKRDHLATAIEAEEELTKMLIQDDSTTDAESTTPIKLFKKKPRVLLPRKKEKSNISNISLNFNELAKEALNVASPNKSGLSGANKPKVLFEKETDVILISSQPQMENIDINNVQNSQIFTLENDFPSTSFLNVENNHEIQELLSHHSKDENYQKIIDNQELILQNQESFKKQLANLCVMMETHLTTRNYNKKDKCEEIIDFQFQPVSNAEELNNLEKNLKTPEFEKKIIDKLAIYCGRSGNEYGINVCYSLIDRVFSRQFLTCCSWAGGSKDGKKKIPFKIYNNVLMLFFRIVNLADKNFSIEDCEIFFKNILKNATKRSQISTVCRKSKCKRRPKKLEYKPQMHHQMAESETSHSGINEKDNLSGVTPDSSFDEDLQNTVTE